MTKTSKTINEDSILRCGCTYYLPDYPGTHADGPVIKEPMRTICHVVALGIIGSGIYTGVRGWVAWGLLLIFIGMFIDYILSEDYE